METNNVKEKFSLLDWIFSWSIKDVLNDDLYRGQVKQIPKTFSSSQDYLESFINPLIEETRISLSSSFTTLSHHSFCCEIESVEESEELVYKVKLKKDNDDDDDDHDDDDDDDHDDDDEDEENYAIGDLIAITNVRPKSLGDLERPGWPYIIAYVHKMHGDDFDLLIMSSKPIFVEKHCMSKRNKIEAHYAVKLMNLTTNLRIWSALHSDRETGNMSIIANVLRPPFVDTEDCSICDCEESLDAAYSGAERRICSSDLNESQKAAVLSCVGTRKCGHTNAVKLIWGPPGTGKTKMVSFLLQRLLKVGCRTLTCAPTNVAVLGVAKRVVRGVRESHVRVGYGLGDVVVFGNAKRMKIKNHRDLRGVFLEHRRKVLARCYGLTLGWKTNLLYMVSLLDDPEELYRVYVLEKEAKNSEEERRKREDKQAVARHLKADANKKKKKKKKKKDKKKQTDKDMENEDHLSFEEFVKARFNYAADNIYFCVENLYKHLPTSRIPLELVDEMFEASAKLKRFHNSLRSVSDEGLKEVFQKGSISSGDRLKLGRDNIIVTLKSLPPELPERHCCLEDACLLFCTVSSSAKLYTLEKTCELVVIDEAAQLKECESTIPLQLPGIRHAFLIGDEKQLPAMVESKVSEAADFGRSLFERLALLGHRKLLLGVQHRMHPSISLFPNREFYDNKILDGLNVRESSYFRRFLAGEMYGTYSFINVPHGREAFDKSHSRINMVEVSVVSEIVAALYKEFLRCKKPVRVGVISPYKAQVHAISERFGKHYGSDPQSCFSVSVRSVDGFQGGEEDVIIISTVRCNVGGSIGFLSNRQRVNVALTRARHCLWIVGSGTTLGNSRSVWKKLIVDAKNRSCFHNAEEDPSLAQAIVSALLELNHFDVVSTSDSLLFKAAKWKVCFSKEFWRSIGRANNDELRKRVFSLLERLSSGWRQQEEKSDQAIVNAGSSSLFLEIYEVTKQMYLVWAIDILEDASNCSQVLRVWDVSPAFELQNLAKRLDIEYGSYTIDKMSRCKHKLCDGNLVVPMKWPVESGSWSSKPMASLSLRDDQETSWRNSRIKSEAKYRKARW